MDKFERLPECELQIMKIIWDNAPSVSQPEIKRQLEDRNKRAYGRTTISTWLGRMKKKGFVKSTIQRGISHYSPLVNEEEYRKNAMSEFMSFWFSNSPKELFHALSENGMLTQQEKEKLKESLN